jgi:hypothetical protein
MRMLSELILIFAVFIILLVLSYIVSKKAVGEEYAER